ncbi:iron-containing alcohol dehydrogenase [Kitasatospora sp. NPDC050467]|uniref:iron-containing alcohol dehydrogenase n=1 Tax=unclassified Kitasatospora TaxID=2633591 RepID=UPI003246C4C0
MVAGLSLPRIVRVGRGAAQEPGDVVAGLGLNRPLLVTAAFLVGTGAAERLTATLLQAGLDPRLFADTVPDPTTDSLVAGLAALHEHRADSVTASPSPRSAPSAAICAAPTRTARTPGPGRP